MSEEFTQPWSPEPQQNNENMVEQNNEFAESQVEAESAEASAEAPEKPIRGTKTSPSVKASMRANQLVKNRYKFTQQTIGDKQVYILEANSMSFDRILRRSPREVNKRSDNYIIPLGSTCSEAIICAYGLSNSEIYHEEQWMRLLAAFNSDMNEENTTKLLRFLRSAAYLKYLRVSGQMVNTNDPYEFISTIINVPEMDIVNFFNEMVK